MSDLESVAFCADHLTHDPGNFPGDFSRLHPRTLRPSLRDTLRGYVDSRCAKGIATPSLVLRKCLSGSQLQRLNTGRTTTLNPVNVRLPHFLSYLTALPSLALRVIKEKNREESPTIAKRVPRMRGATSRIRILLPGQLLQRLSAKEASSLSGKSRTNGNEAPTT